MGFVLDQLNLLPNVRAKSMFGAYGLYCAGNFFGILDEGRLYFKTDARSLAEYSARGMGPFSYERRGEVRAMAYHEVPPEILEQPQELTVWARRALEIASASALKRPKFTSPGKSKPGIRRATRARSPKSRSTAGRKSRARFPA